MATANGNPGDDFEALRGEWDDFQGRVTAQVAQNERRIEGMGRLIRTVRDELVNEIRGLKSDLDDWRETTDVRNMRRREIERAHERVAEAEEMALTSSLAVQRTKRRTRQIIAIVSVAAPALWELVRTVAAHWH